MKDKGMFRLSYPCLLLCYLQSNIDGEESKEKKYNRNLLKGIDGGNILLDEEDKANLFSCRCT